MQTNLVSIITPSYNSSRFISQTIESVLAQTYQDWEMIIVDDVSPDNSNDIIDEYCKKDSRITLIKLEKNSGPAVARNKAIEEAKGRYIAFLDADDLWHPEKLEKQINFMNENNLALSYASYYIISEDNVDLGIFTTKERIDYFDLLKTNSIGCLTAMYDTKLIGKVLMPNIIKKQDYGLWLKILKQIDYAKGLLEPLAYYRLVSNSVSSNKVDGIKYIWKIFRDVEKLNIFQSFYYFCFYVYYGLRKYK
jgi:glycosyltransferase involved in cell wall biosynthesis